VRTQQVASPGQAGPGPGRATVVWFTLSPFGAPQAGADLPSGPEPGGDRAAGPRSASRGLPGLGHENCAARASLQVPLRLETARSGHCSSPSKDSSHGADLPTAKDVRPRPRLSRLRRGHNRSQRGAVPERPELMLSSASRSGPATGGQSARTWPRKRNKGSGLVGVPRPKRNFARAFFQARGLAPGPRRSKGELGPLAFLGSCAVRPKVKPDAPAPACR